MTWKTMGKDKLSFDDKNRPAQGYDRSMNSEDPYHYYAVRRLNPFRGVIQVAGNDEARALSPNGREWEIQIRAETPDMWGAGSAGEPVTRFLRFGVWSASGGLKRVPAHPLLDLKTMLSRTEELTGSLAREAKNLPFPLLDRFELWLLDGKERMPLALLASSTDSSNLHKSMSKRWVCADRANDDFPAPDSARERPPHPHMSRLERLVAGESGHSTAQWFERTDNGAGSGLPVDGLEERSNRRLEKHRFPELLLKEDWSNPLDRSLVLNYIQWLSPYLLTLQHLSDETRGRLEKAACTQASQVENTWTLFPRIIDRQVIEAARVEARLRRAR
jgi:hypothetical protein